MVTSEHVAELDAFVSVSLARAAAVTLLAVDLPQPLVVREAVEVEHLAHLLQVLRRHVTLVVVVVAVVLHLPLPQLELALAPLLEGAHVGVEVVGHLLVGLGAAEDHVVVLAVVALLRLLDVGALTSLPRRIVQLAQLRLLQLRPALVRQVILHLERLVVLARPGRQVAVVVVVAVAVRRVGDVQFTFLGLARDPPARNRQSCSLMHIYVRGVANSHF